MPDVESLLSAERRAVERRRKQFESSPPSGRAVEFDINNFHRHDEINQYLYDLEGAEATGCPSKTF